MLSYDDMVRYCILWTLITGLLATGLIFPPLMDNDAAEYASIALRMHQTDDFANIINRDVDYLDKPHLLFWSALVGYKFLGVSPAGYRLISVLIGLLGAYATYRLGKLLYRKQVGLIAAVIYITSQAIILASHDVRTDSLLTNLVVIALWLFVDFIKRDQLISLLGGGAALALAVASKGMIAVMVCGLLMLCYVLFKWRITWKINLKWGLAVAAFVIVLSPFLICYYYQFDLHPEKLVNGRTGVSGVRFLLWDQSFDRFTGVSNAKNNPEFFFFHHTFLWAFLPWTIIALAAFAARIRHIVRKGFKAMYQREQLTFLGTFCMFTFMSLSSFKLPHYINVFFPMIAIATAAFMVTVKLQRKVVHRLVITQLIVNLLMIVLVGVLNAWSFPVQSMAISLGAFFLVALFAVSYWIRFESDPLNRVWIPSTVMIVLVNFLMNMNFYPALARYQAGSTLAVRSKEFSIPQEHVFVTSDRYRSFDFYTGYIHRKIDLLTALDKSASGESFYLLVRESEKDIFDENNICYQVIAKAPDYRITMLKGNFINPGTRRSTYQFAYLLKVHLSGEVPNLNEFASYGREWFQFTTVNGNRLTDYARFLLSVVLSIC